MHNKKVLLMCIISPHLAKTVCPENVHVQLKLSNLQYYALNRNCKYKKNQFLKIMFFYLTFLGLFGRLLFVN